MDDYSVCYSLQEKAENLLRLDPSAKEVTYNPTYEQLFAPEVRECHSYIHRLTRTSINSHCKQYTYAHTSMSL